MLHNTSLERLASGKQSNLLVQYVSYEANVVFWLRPQVSNRSCQLVLFVFMSWNENFFLQKNHSNEKKGDEGEIEKKVEFCKKGLNFKTLYNCNLQRGVVI